MYHDDESVGSRPTTVIVDSFHLYMQQRLQHPSVVWQVPPTHLPNGRNTGTLCTSLLSLLSARWGELHRRNYARPSTEGASLSTDWGEGLAEDREGGTGLRNGKQTRSRDMFPVLIHVEESDQPSYVCGLLRGATRCQGGTGEVHCWATLCSVVPLQSVRTANLGACGESGRPAWWRAQERNPPPIPLPLWRPDDSPVWTWPWLPSPSFDRGPPDNRILLLKRGGEERNSFVTVALIAPFPLCSRGSENSAHASTHSLVVNVGIDLMHVQEGVTHHRWRTPSPGKVSSLSQSPQTASLQEDRERILAQETGSGNATAARSHFGCFVFFVFFS